MPGFDGTGPMGAGPMTGGGRGVCRPGWGTCGYGGFGSRGGFGPGFGRGRAYGRSFGRPGTNSPYGNPYAMRPKDELSSLKCEAGYIQEELNAVNKRIAELEPDTSDQ